MKSKTRKVWEILKNAVTVIFLIVIGVLLIVPMLCFGIFLILLFILRAILTKLLKKNTDIIEVEFDYYDDASGEDAPFEELI